MNGSISEIAALARKAARGAGLSWSMADEFAFAFAWLCRNGVDGTEFIATHLSTVSALGVDAVRLSSLKRPWCGGEHGLCAVSAGTTFLDLAADLQKEPHTRAGGLADLISPILFVPFAAHASHRLARLQAAEDRASIDLCDTTCEARVSCRSFVVHIAANPHASWLVNLEGAPEPRVAPENTSYQIELCGLRAGDESLPRRLPVRHHRVTVEPPTLESLNRLAARTYAPATAASRSGAGAGTLDND